MKKFTLLVLSLLSVSCSEEPDDGSLQGYVEGRQLNLAPRSSGIITGLNVTEGDMVEKGAMLFSVDSERAEAALSQAISARAAATSQLENLKKGGRPEEVRAAEETLREAQAAFKLAEQNYSRTENLVERGVFSTARLDQDRATLDAGRARVTEAQSRLEIIGLPARPDIIAAAERQVEARNSEINRAQTELRDRSIVAPAAGRIETVYRRAGEIAGPSAPVLSLLPPDQKRIRFFVKEPMLASIKYGGSVGFACDNCASVLTGEIIYISDTAEFTPPVIFSEKERVKLVYMIEARPSNPDGFHNGQPVKVTIQ
jgi:HlyD family secretion protein